MFEVETCENFYSSIRRSFPADIKEKGLYKKKSYYEYIKCLYNNIYIIK